MSPLIMLAAAGLALALASKKGGGAPFSNGMPADANLPPETRQAVEAALVAEPPDASPGNVAVLVSSLVQMATMLQQNYPLAAKALYARILELQQTYSPGV
jgi:hypothetical protein